MSKRNLKIILQDILEEIERINRFISGINSYKEFEENEIVFYAVLKALENIGEAVKHIPEEVRNLYSLDWRKIAGLRDIIVHEYFNIDSEIIWDIIKNKLPELKTALVTLKKVTSSKMD